MLQQCNVGGPRDDNRGVTHTRSAPPRGLEDTYRELRLPLLRLVYLICGSRELSEDIVQTAFATAQPRWEQIDNHAAYLRRAVVNLVKDDQRRFVRRRSITVPELPVVTHDPELDETWAFVQALPPIQRAVIVLHYYEDLSLVDVAGVLDRPASTVRSDLRRALDRLRKALS